MSTVGLWLLSMGLGTLGASAAGPLMEHLSPSGRARRHSHALPQVAIAEARPGALVKIVARLELEADSLLGPLSGRRCAHYVAGVALGPRRRRPLLERTQSTPFRLVDASGELSVDPRGALVDCVTDLFWRASELTDEERFELEAFLYAQGASGAKLLGARSRLRYYEGALEPGELITAVGVVSGGDGPVSGRTYRQSSEVRSLRGTERVRLFLSDGAHYM